MRSHFCFCPPSEFARARKTDFISSPYLAPSARTDFSLSAEEVSICGLIITFARTFFEGKE
ncbi:MAG: hypothetical protein A3H68_01725 [Candidatus Taylorbacteria bacterium RIFCSPLOWO2_02_FULL_46_40]|uniref:Uncharacterized protein n=1 Tax=Candidatus Taylorbacteria bacterium RIFCSPLOWO2_02_FULL_46_40 TaxID=1802329 RepID=A0A1G2NZJ6_9BACT|nr:MAG: hypothetical protein A3H68_01725 [Candidatus Taylorbacteria bacterium RIFCSPLOWO2_02_FULL_46_40]